METLIFGFIASKIGIEVSSLMTILAYIGLGRLVMKPLIAGVEELVKQTPSKEDDKFMKKAKDPIKWVMFLLDWLASFKFPKK